MTDRRRFALGAAVALVLAMVPLAPATAAPETPSAPFARGTAIVGVRPDALKAAKASVRALGGRIESYDPEGSFLVVDTGAAVPGWIASVEHRPGVAYAEPDYIATFDAVPDDPSYGGQWGLPQVSAPAAWDIATGSPEVAVGVIDTGVDATHEDLASRMWTNPGEVPGNGVDDDGNGYVDDVNGIDCAAETGTQTDTNGHGTAVAGVIAAAGNNGVGVSGTAWDARIMALRFTDASGAGTVSAAVRCIDYAIAMGAALTNNSWHVPYSQTLLNAVARARDAGLLFVAAAGNNGSNTDTLLSVYPADYDLDNIVSVAASDPTDALASFSSYGPLTVDLAAPGTDVLTTTFGGGYGTLSGTSLAAPFVTGAAALVLSAHPGSTYQQVRNRLLGSVDPVPALAGKVGTGGRLNVARALEADTEPPGASGLAVTGTARTSVSLSWTAPGEDGTGGGAVSSYLLAYAPSGSGAWASAPAPVPAAPGTQQTTTVAGLAPDTAYDLALVSVDNAGNGATETATGRTIPGLTVLATDAESGAGGWTAQPPWAVTTEAAHSPSQAWSDSPGALSPLNVNVSLTSPAFSLAGVVGPRLTFWTRYQMTQGYQTGFVEVSTNGGSSWTRVGPTYTGASAFRPVELDLSSFAGASSVQVRFRMRSTNVVTLDGWYVDDVIVSGADTTPPASPQSLTAAPGQGQVALDWDDVADADVAGYAVYRTSDPPSAEPRTWWKIGSPATSDLLDLAVVSGRETYYRVSATDTTGNESQPSTEVAVTPAPAPAEYAPDTITLSKGTSYGDPISAMAAADEGAVFRVGSVLSGGRHRTSALISRTLPVGTPVATRLTVVLEGSYSSTVTQNLYVRNWVTGTWDAVDTQAVSSAEGTFGWSTSDPGPYISSTRIVRIRVDSIGGATPYTSGTDAVRLALYP